MDVLHNKACGAKYLCWGWVASISCKIRKGLSKVIKDPHFLTSQGVRLWITLGWILWPLKLSTFMNFVRNMRGTSMAIGTMCYQDIGE